MFFEDFSLSIGTNLKIYNMINTRFEKKYLVLVLQEKSARKARALYVIIIIFGWDADGMSVWVYARRSFDVYLQCVLICCTHFMTICTHLLKPKLMTYDPDALQAHS